MAKNMSLPGMNLMKGVGLGPLNVGNVLDTMGFVKKAWGAMNAPSAFMPTVDVEELKKRIVDLQAVEQWLAMNLGMIQTSIQALEVQKATIETLKGVTKGWVPGGQGGAALNPLLNATENSALSPEAFAATLFGTPNVEPAPRPAPRGGGSVSAKPTKQAKARAAQVSAKTQNAAPGASTWLEFLQGQFNQVAQAAMSGATLKANQKVTNPKASSPKATSAATKKPTKSTTEQGAAKSLAKKVRVAR